MAYTDDSVKAKLSALNETQEAIVTVAQWIMFHRRHAERTVNLWMQRLLDSSSSKRLNLIYLANEVIQQSKARRKFEFVGAFSPVIAEATHVAYKSATYDIQQKIRRVIEVWRQRQVFEPDIQDAIESKANEVDSARNMKKSGLGGSLFGGGGNAVPFELQRIVELQIAASKASTVSQTALSSSIADYGKLMDPNAVVPTPPVHAARLSALLKSLANAQSTLSETVKSRKALIAGLEKLVETNRTALEAEVKREADIVNYYSASEAMKREVEDCIMRGLVDESPPPVSKPIQPGGKTASAADAIPDQDNETTPLQRPPFESITPPPPESLPLEGCKVAHNVSEVNVDTTESHPNPATAAAIVEFLNNATNSLNAVQQSSVLPSCTSGPVSASVCASESTTASASTSTSVGTVILPTLAASATGVESILPTSNSPPLKRRRTGVSEDEIPGFSEIDDMAKDILG